ncbi:HEPN domain-containing protein [Ferroplasma sp.]|uniref:HEPN domain-containing protein n=1 Tax=Ferroplasma sp. TaxID=2591003 RepID=UPI00307ECA21
MPSRPLDWLNQARRDLEQSEDSLKNGKYEWACFAAQQSAEKAVKAIYYSLNKEIWSHSISRMLFQLNDIGVKNDLIEKSKELDRVYTGTRYPDYYTEGSPFEYYSREDAERCINHAKEIFRFCSQNIQS